MKDLTPKLARIKDDFAAYLSTITMGQAVHSPILEYRFNISGAEVRALINNLSNSGMPIGNTIRVDENTTIKAYFHAKNYEELFPTIQDIESRAFELLQRAKNLKKIYSTDNEPSFL